MYTFYFSRNKSIITFFIMIDMTCYNLCIIKVMSIINVYKSNITSIITNHINHYEKCYDRLITREIEGIHDTVLFKR